ncbi:MAG: YadA-like family protein, partial [Alphaproteobacteria bacterium]|nr:YadA-like family protein [Alphaproteobacteria bacterium]
AGSANTAEQNAKDYADGLAGDLTSLTTNEKSTLVGAINENTGAIAAETTRAMEEEAAIRSEFAAADELTLSSAKAFANAGDELTLSKANAYTDAKVDTLEKNVSGGIAAATALSAVEVSNVKRGEMSVGGGYGYYNGQSAGAFGMAMGLSDNWSVNAGAGIASGDKTQVSFRAGTNYKFKLF